MNLLTHNCFSHPSKIHLVYYLKIIYSLNTFVSKTRISGLLETDIFSPILHIKRNIH